MAHRMAARRFRGRGTAPIQITETCGRAVTPVPDGHAAPLNTCTEASTTMKRNTTWFGLTLAVLLLTALAPAPARAQQTDLSGAWLGTLQAGPTQLRLVFHLTRQADGTYGGAMDSPDQGAQGIPASAVEVTGDSVHVTLASLNAVYRGQVQPGGERIAGTFTQYGTSFPLNLERTEAVPGRAPRPQDPKEPLPYHSEDVAYENPAAG